MNNSPEATADKACGAWLKISQRRWLACPCVSAVAAFATGIDPYSDPGDLNTTGSL